MTTDDALTIERRGRVAILSFNRPSVLNAFDGPLVEATTRAMTELSADEEVLAIVVRGEGRAFSAGFDLKAGAATAGQRSLADWRRVLEADFAFIMAFWDCPKPTIAAIHGYCIGGAFELSLACDITVAAAGTRLGAPEVKFGSWRGCDASAVRHWGEGRQRDIADRRRPPQRGKSARPWHRQSCHAGGRRTGQGDRDRGKHHSR
jgi:enoyl-CoA hydratase/carnithine racemase